VCPVLAASSGSGLAPLWSIGVRTDVLRVHSVIFEADEQCYFLQDKTVCLGYHLQRNRLKKDSF
jgi:hypothetical protein